MKRYLFLLICGLPVVVMAATRHSAHYYFMHPKARTALEMHCYPGSGHSVAAADCRNAWQAGRHIVQSVVKAPTHGTGWGAVEAAAAHAADYPLYPHSPEEQMINPAYWRMRGLKKIKDYAVYCPTHPTAARPVCMAADEARNGPWQPTQKRR